MEYLALTAPGFGWTDHVEGYEKVDFPVMPDTVGSVFNLYGATYYDVFLVDKKSRLVTKQPDFYDATHMEKLKQRIRQLYAE